MEHKTGDRKWEIKAVKGLLKADFGSVSSQDGSLTESIILKSHKAFNKNVALGCGVIAIGLVLTIVGAYYGGGEAYMNAEEDALEKIGCFK